jgi:hypothetical protein
MAGYFAVADTPNERRPFEQLTEGRSSIDCFWLYREGWLTPGSSAVLKIGPVPYRLAVREARFLEIDGQTIRVVSHKCLPAPIFQCPRCGADKYRLYVVDGAWVCRDPCGKLSYASRHRLRSRGARGYHRAIYLRRRLRASLILFTPIASKPPSARKYLKLALELRKIEASLLEHLRSDVCAVLERRINANRPGHRR